MPSKPCICKFKDNDDCVCRSKIKGCEIYCVGLSDCDFNSTTCPFYRSKKDKLRRLKKKQQALKADGIERTLDELEELDSVPEEWPKDFLEEVLKESKN